MEEWKKIPGYPDRFEVSSEGKVRVCCYEYSHRLRSGKVERRYRQGRVLQQTVNLARGGYAQVTMTYSGDGVLKVWSGKVHRLVALAFLQNQSDLSEVNHKDSNKLNNHVSNLEWVTKSENNLHSYASGTRKPHPKKTAVVGTNGNTTVEFDSLLAAQKSGLFTMAAIQRCLAGRAKHHKGFVWVKKTQGLF